MAKPSAPLLSLGAAGTIGKSVVYASWRGKSYARRHVVPANPNSIAQQGVRTPFQWCQQVYKWLPADVVAAWDAYAKGKALTGRNAFSKFNMAVLAGATDIDILTMSPGALGGLPPLSVVATPGSGQLSIAIEAPPAPNSDWTIQKAIGAVIKSQSPQSGTDYITSSGEDATSTYAVVITGLDAVEYQVFGFFVWTRPDGKTAYSQSVQNTGTPS